MAEERDPADLPRSLAPPVPGAPVAGDGGLRPLPHKRPGPMMRFLVIVFGVMLIGIGRAAFAVGGVFGVIVGVVMDVLAVVIIFIAIGLVEWWARRRDRRSTPLA